MSREDAELVKRAIQAVVEKDYATVNALFHPDHVLVPFAGRVEGEARGSEGFRDLLETYRDLGWEWEFEIEGAVDRSGQRVLLVGNIQARGSASGMELEQRAWYQVTVREGKVWRTVAYTDPDEAIKALTGE
jgi:ketosteroid isomerase-like protein